MAGKTPVVIASLLKPVDDTRMFEKIAVSISQTNKYEINIIGFRSKKISETEKIILHPIFNFKRLGFKRFLAPWKFLRLLIKLKPRITVITSPDLLFPAIFYNLFFNNRIIYDIRENYFKNILHLSTLPFGVRHSGACYVRFKEWLLAPLISWFFLAEASYEKELKFIGSKYTILENKAIKPSPQLERKSPAALKNLVFTGTLGTGTGVFEAIRLAKNLKPFCPDLHLKIVGYCAIKEDRARLQKAIEDSSFISGIGISSLVPHEEIIKAIEEADAAIVSYRVNKVIAHKRPTKIYEYMAHHLPILIPVEAPWVPWCHQYTACLPYHPDNENWEQLPEKFLNTNFYTPKPETEILWESQIKDLLAVLEKLDK